MSSVRGPKKARMSWGLVMAAMLALVLFLVAYLMINKPEVVPSQLLFEKIFPAGLAVTELEKVNFDVDGVLQHPVFLKLQEKGPIPISVPPLGKPNPFL